MTKKEEQILIESIKKTQEVIKDLQEARKIKVCPHCMGTGLAQELC